MTPLPCKGKAVHTSDLGELYMSAVPVFWENLLHVDDTAVHMCIRIRIHVRMIRHACM